jgi:AAA ATPase domain
MLVAAGCWWGCVTGRFPRGRSGRLVDIADALGLDLADQVSGPSNRQELFRHVRARLATSPTLFVIEDLHWADEATLDFVRFLGRRLTDQPLLVVVTYRDEGNDALTAVLGDLSSCSTTTRLQIPPLTAEAVRQWVVRAGSSLNAVALHHRTSGNPFFIGEVLNSDGQELPAGLRDAVLANVMRLSVEGRTVLNAAAVVGPATGDLVVAAAGAPAAALDQCCRAGLIMSDGQLLPFRHHLIREVIENSLSRADRSALAAGALDWLLRHADTDVRRLATSLT